MAKAVDRATAFINEVAGHGTYKIICKASNHDPVGPKKKHVDALLQITNNPRTQMAVLVDLVSERLKDKNWVVAFKTLIVAHNLMTLGHEKFMQCMATRSSTFDMELFADRTNSLSVTMSDFLRKYANYLICLCTSYRTLAMDVNRIPKGDNSPFKNMDPVKILKAASIIQKQLDTLLEVDMTSSDLTNGVINTAFLMLYKDLVKLYTVYNDIMINLLEKFFEMKKPQCRETIEFYRRFLTRQEGVQTFLQLAEQVGIDKQTHLNLRQVPEDLLPALESHLSEMDTLKKSSGDASPSIRAASEKLAALKKTEKKPDPPPVTPTSPQALPSASSEVLEAQRKRFEELKRQASIPRSMNNASSETSSLAQQSTTSTAKSSANDLLGLDVSSTSTDQDPWKSSPSPATSNPFQPVSTAAPVVSNASPNTQPNDPWGAPPPPSAYQEVDLFTEIRGGSDSKTSFDAVFSSPSQPTQSGSSDWGGGILQPQAVGPLASQELLQPTKPTIGLAEDVDSSLAMAAANLSMEMGPGSNKAGITKKTDHQWTPIKESVKTGGTNFQKQTIQARTMLSHPSGPSGPMQPRGGGGAPVNWEQGMYQGHFPQQQYPTQPMGPPMAMGPYNMIPPAQSFGMQPVAAPMMPAGGWYSGQQAQSFQQPQQQQPNDPFGSIPSQNKSLF